MSRFRFVSEHHDTYGVKRLCQVLGVSRSGYYVWTMRGPSAHAERDLELAAVVCEVHSRSRRTYGAPRVHAELGRLGHRTGRKRVARLMREYGLVGAHSRRKWRTGKPNIRNWSRPKPASSPDRNALSLATRMQSRSGQLAKA